MSSYGTSAATRRLLAKSKKRVSKSKAYSEPISSRANPNFSRHSSAFLAAGAQQELAAKFGLPGARPRRSNPMYERRKPAKISVAKSQIAVSSPVKDEPIPDPTAVLTINQRLGLSSVRPLTDPEWVAVLDGAFRQRRHWDKCFVCLTPLNTDVVTVLPCGHMCHAACLSSMERLSGSDDSKSCGLCRQTYIEPLISSEPPLRLRAEAASIIQRCMVGWFCRHSLRQEGIIPPSSDPRVRRLMIKRSLNSFAKLSQQLSAEWQRETERVLLESREAMAVATGVVKEPYCGQQNCPICLMKLSGVHRDVVSLSCGHLYHRSCLSAAERVQGDAPKCPVCRQNYVIMV